ncbi:hypothetical protein DFO66_102296 [Brevibacterium sanguinis]|uniref:Uncharacterized protein n=2 Tax=Brevibacterium TaxID=1696 RepID=A0A366IM16_9MICO|nr:hypothetical protein DFO66_102296 [Brevibacterium sanguinis]RBP73768.1 hypothetical protein DFO65_102296 [Brevibacterium celere]
MTASVADLSVVFEREVFASVDFAAEAFPPEVLALVDFAPDVFTADDFPPVDFALVDFRAVEVLEEVPALSPASAFDPPARAFFA